MGIAGIKVVHAMPGRVRIKISRLKGDPAFGREIQERLSDARGIQRVEVNSVTGSVLVLYHAEEMDSFEALISLAGSFAPLLPELNMGELQAWLDSFGDNSTFGDNSNGQPSVAARLATLFGALNHEVGKSTGGLDLRLLLPLILFFFGVRGLLVAEKVTVPAWYDLLWFAFGTFFMLNPGRVEEPR
jgi:Heavy metal associated domain 2